MLGLNNNNINLGMRMIMMEAIIIGGLANRACKWHSGLASLCQVAVSRQVAPASALASALAMGQEHIHRAIEWLAAWVSPKPEAYYGKDDDSFTRLEILEYVSNCERQGNQYADSNRCHRIQANKDTKEGNRT